MTTNISEQQQDRAYVNPWAWAVSNAQRVYNNITYYDAGEVYLSIMDDIIDVCVGAQTGADENLDHMCVRIGYGISPISPLYLDYLVLTGTDEDAQIHEQIRKWAEAHRGADKQHTAYVQQIRAKHREHTLRIQTSHPAVRVCNIVGCRDKYMVRDASVIPWGFRAHFDPVMACEAATVLLLPVTPWRI